MFQLMIFSSISALPALSHFETIVRLIIVILLHYECTGQEWTHTFCLLHDKGRVHCKIKGSNWRIYLTKSKLHRFSTGRLNWKASEQPIFLFLLEHGIFRWIIDLVNSITACDEKFSDRKGLKFILVKMVTHEQCFYKRLKWLSEPN